MTRGNAAQTKVFHKGKEEDFVVFVDSAKAVADWKKDRSIPLAQVVSGFKVFVTHKYALFSDAHQYISRPSCTCKVISIRLRRIDFTLPL